MTGVPGGVLVVGYGNGLRSDDGVGPVVADRLAVDPRMAGFDVRTAHQLTPELAFDASRVSLLVLVDAAEDRAPGVVEIRRLEGGAGSGSAGVAADAAGPSLTHHVDPAAVAGLARELFGAAPAVVSVSVGGASFEVGESLTTIVQAAVPAAVEAVVRVIREHADA